MKSFTLDQIRENFPLVANAGARALAVDPFRPEWVFVYKADSQGDPVLVGEMRIEGLPGAHLRALYEQLEWEVSQGENEVSNDTLTALLVAKRGRP